MKNVIVFILLAVAFSVNCQAQEDGHLNITTLFSFPYDRPNNPNPEQLSIIRYILQNTYENNIHRMRGEKDNQVRLFQNSPRVLKQERF
jgi:hypothetical protein